MGTTAVNCAKRVGPAPVTWCCHTEVESAQETSRRRLLRRGFWLEYLTLGWNVVGHREETDLNGKQEHRARLDDSCLLRLFHAFA